MLDVYARTGRLDEVEALFSQLDRLDSVTYSILIGAYARNHRPEKATEVLLKLLDQRHERLDYATLLVGVLDAWAESSQSDGYARATAVFRLVDSEPCRSMGVQHGVASYGAMLKCLVRLHKHEDSGECAEELLNAMEQNNLAPNAICYNLAVRACYNAGDMERAEKLMTRFQNSDTPPTARTFSDILMHFAAMGTPKAADRCEAILAHMKSMSRQRPEITPDQVSYNCVMTAWAKANVPESPRSMARIFETMMSEGIEPDFVSCNQLLSALCKSDRKEDILQADKVLMRLETTSHNPEIPNSLNYMEVMV
jgi:pentatricopeptide repeat protein